MLKGIWHCFCFKAQDLILKGENFMSFIGEVGEDENLLRNVYRILDEIIKAAVAIEKAGRSSRSAIGSFEYVLSQIKLIEMFATQGLVEMSNIVKKGLQPLPEGSPDPFLEKLKNISMSNKNAKKNGKRPVYIDADLANHWINGTPEKKNGLEM
ncbi:MAG: hypothetical protein LBH47_00575 [Christensenellaceae bacterium]|nr:hypothetical protein [Christensenellaceae bacterium]